MIINFLHSYCWIEAYFDFAAGCVYYRQQEELGSGFFVCISLVRVKFLQINVTMAQLIVVLSFFLKYLFLQQYSESLCRISNIHYAMNTKYIFA